MGLFFKKKKNQEYEELNSFDSNDFKMDYVDEDETFLSIDKGIIEDILEEEKDSRNIDRTSYIENCCEQMASCSKRIDDAKKEYGMVNNYLNDIFTIENLDPSRKSELIYFAKRIKTLNDGKKELRQFGEKMSGDKYLYIQRIEEDIKDILKDMQDNENLCQQLKMDLHNIEGERIALREEQRFAIKAMNTIKSLLKIGIATFAIILLMLFVAQIQFDADMSVPIYGTIMLCVAGGAAAIVMNQKYYNELKVIGMKQQKAVRLLNKYKLRYVNAKSSLDYSYEKHNVKSAYELNELWGLYLNVKKERIAYEKNNDELFKTISSMEEFLESLKISDVSVWPSQINAILDEREMTQIRHTLNVRRQKLRKSIEYNMNTIERYKEQIKNVVKKNPVLAKEILSVLDKY